MKKVFIIGLIFSICMGMISCGNPNNKNDKPVDNKAKRESLEKANRYLVNSEDREIKNYVRRHNLDMVETGSGVLYQVINPGNGKNAKEGMIVTLDYRVKLITGKIVYSSKENGPLKFKIGHGGVASGLEEAILNLRDGDEAIIIIPSHLAYGLAGDKNKIPGRSTIIYELKVTNLK